MGLFIFVDTYIFSLVILLILLMRLYSSQMKNDLQYHLFMWLLILNMSLLSIELIGWIIDSQSIFNIRVFHYLINGLLLILTPLAPIIWLLYADYQVYSNRIRVKKIFYIFLVPFIINFLLVLSSPITRWMFYLDEQCEYHRGSLFFIMVLISFFTMFYSFVFILINKNKVEKKKYIPLLIFTLPPIITGLIQTFIYGVTLIWNGMTIAILIVYLNIQDHRFKLDHLTGLYNRGNLDRFLESRIRYYKDKNKFAGVMIDLDDLKETNDLYGHINGDKVLISLANFLKKFFHKDDFVARYAGDEFVVIFDIDHTFTKERLFEKIQTQLKEFNTSVTDKHKLSFSIGCAIFDPIKHKTSNHFYKHIDELMYDAKKKKNT